MRYVHIYSGTLECIIDTKGGSVMDLSVIDFKDIYAGNADEQPGRYEAAVRAFTENFGEGDGIEIYSAPGRTEILGNHTDHQHGEVLAASVNLDAIAVVRKTSGDTVRVISGSSPVITISDLSKKEDEKGTTGALIKGMISTLKDGGFTVGGFDAYITSDVIIGAGLSSSAAFETLIGTVISGLYNDMRIDPVIIAKAGQKAENVFFGKPCGLMDQMACSIGNMVHIDFRDPSEPVTEKIGFDFDMTGYSLCITDTKGSHSDLTHEYAAVPQEMKEIARLLGHDVLRSVTLDDILDNITELRGKAGDRAVLRAIHFEEENARVAKGVKALKENNLKKFLDMVRDSGNSSFKYLQNVYTSSDVRTQNVSIALAVSDSVLTDGECSRVHGGGFAGTIQAFVKNENTDKYRSAMDKVFGDGSCRILKIRKYGGIKVI